VLTASAPGTGRQADVLLEGAIEGRLEFVANLLRDLRDAAALASRRRVANCMRQRVR
jgi:hypothetical protein